MFRVDIYSRQRRENYLAGSTLFEIEDKPFVSVARSHVATALLRSHALLVLRRVELRLALSDLVAGVGWLPQ